MSNIYVQFADTTEEVVISFFGAPQDLIAYPNQGSISANDARWNAYFSTLPAAVQKVLPAPVSA